MADLTPLGLHPYLTVSNAVAAMEFYKTAFGARELQRHQASNSEKIMHGRLEILGSVVMLSDDFPEFDNGRSRTPEAIGGCPITLSLQVENADQLWAQALAAGATVVMPLKDQFWGDRYGQLKDPFGYTWSVGQTVSTPDSAEVEEGAKAAFQ